MTDRVLLAFALAQALAACGRRDEGRAVLREAAALVEETGERCFEAEIYRLEGNLLLDENGSAEAEACYVKALDVARAQEARSLELRAAMAWRAYGTIRVSARRLAIFSLRSTAGLLKASTRSI